MKEITVHIDENDYRFRENTDIGTYYQVFSLDELNLIVKFAGFGSLDHILTESKSEYVDDECKQRHYQADKLFQAIALLSDVKVKKV